MIDIFLLIISSIGDKQIGCSYEKLYKLCNPKRKESFSSFRGHIDIKAPQYSYSTDTQVPEVLKWAEIAQSKLQTDEKLVILNMFKI